MDGASKILTVSYGTFSCTLEGFNDPFSTMKAIAEYFRDLAADDRYFGAEPPTPDAAMLHQIAEREIHRRVEAKIEANGVILRAGDGPVTDAVTAPPAASPTAIESVVAAPAMAESVAAKLMRIRNAVAQAQPVAPVEDYADYGEDLPDANADRTMTIPEPVVEPTADQASDPAVDPAIVEPAPLPEDQLPENSATPPTPALAAEDTLPQDAFPEESAIDGPADHGNDDTVQAAPAPTAEAIAADLAAEPTVHREPEDVPLAQRLDAAPFAADWEPIDLGSDDLADDDLALDVLTPEDWAPEDLAGDDLSGEVHPGPAASVSSDAEAWDVAGAATNLITPVPEPAASAAPVSDAPADDVLADNDLPEPEAVAVVGPPQAEAPVADSASADKARRARARVIKIHRTASADSAAAPVNPDPSALSAEAEADLMAELAALEGESAAAPTPAVAQPLAVGENRKRLDETAGDAAVSRLIGQTNSEMADPQNRRRLAAISHLKAAVAATVAERIVGGTSGPSEADRITPYRSDLTRAVRPSAGGLPSPADRPPLLVLVSAQRIDHKPAAPAQQTTVDEGKTIVRPRRIRAASNLAVQDEVIDDDDDADHDANLFTDARGFVEFSTRLGAQSPTELIEAAAAYAVCVEGRPHFSRPQLIGQVATIQGDGPGDGNGNRETCLRGFGVLLREGKIAKIKRGQFQLTERSTYLVAARKLVG